ncbi:prostamide/prostaglandin F synthase-like [Leptidea sinapis]|uniref:Prostamide/prostaglandin F synthase n=1 Tax=Leptidea sinapis TaxID=189913 RepID=A0A5E4QU01_9NEOP|nr:prostamide/prostaglandin F synthase-like [Leptidea sinapis]VVD00651.1 unnamed protein product [Leptidea sinapis]
MSIDIDTIGSFKVKNIPSGDTVELKSFWQDQSVAIIFFRRWGCMFCRLWAKELSDIAPVLKEHNIKLIGIGVEEVGAQDFIQGEYFNGDLYYVEDTATYQKLGFKRFNLITILSSLLWKQSREAIAKGRRMGLGGDAKGDWMQTGGATLVEKGGKLLNHFKQTGPSDHLSNEEILKCFGLESEYKAETMANKKREEAACSTEGEP